MMSSQLPKRYLKTSVMDDLVVPVASLSSGIRTESSSAS